MANGQARPDLIREIAEVSPEVQTYSRNWTDLADSRLGGEIIEVSDERFGLAQRILSPKPVHKYRFDENGYRFVDGWETTRRRSSGNEWCVIRLGRPGRLRGLLVDTSYFTGNFPMAIAVDGACIVREGDPRAWREVLAYTKLQGNAQKLLHVGSEDVITHLKVNIFPDGGLARIKAFGEVVVDLPDGEVDLAALANGARVIGCNDAHFAAPEQMIAPEPILDWGKGWETRRRREPGHDWAVIALARPGRISRVEIDTQFYSGNQPEALSLQAAYLPVMHDEAILNQALFWQEILPIIPVAGGEKATTSALMPHEPVSHVKVNIHPDGGITRLRLWGTPT